MYGGGIDELDKFQLRDRIRAGEVMRQTEIALKGSEDWKAADSFPELARYFDLVTLKPAATFTPAAKVRDVRPMSERVLNGLTYPIAGGEVLMLIALAVLSIVPFVGWIGSLAGTVIMVSIVRSSADGKLKMPMVDTSDVVDMFRVWLRVVFITLVALAPVFVFAAFLVRAVLTRSISYGTAVLGTGVALIFSALYYPACLATVAVWDNIIASLNPAYIVKVIRIIGADYFIVIGIWFAATFGTALLMRSPLAMIPLVGTLMRSILSNWALFYASHLLGYAVYRHAGELGWE
jgi:hypothetical protein